MKDDVLESAPPTGVRFERDTEVARLVDVLTDVYYRLDTDIGQLRMDRYLETASGREMDLRARPLGVTRPKGENDETFRLRALAGRVRSASDSTFDDFARTALEILDADPGDITLSVDYTDERGAVIVQADSDVIEASPFTDSTIVEILEGALQMSRRVVLRELDSFQFSEQSTTDQKAGKGFGQGQWTA